MRYGFHFSFIQKKSCFDKRFTITGRAGMYDFYPFRELTVNVLDRMDGCSKRIAVIVVIERVQKGTVFAYKSSLCCGTSCINAKECLPVIS